MDKCKSIKRDSAVSVEKNCEDNQQVPELESGITLSRSELNFFYNKIIELALQIHYPDNTNLEATEESAEINSEPSKTTSSSHSEIETVVEPKEVGTSCSESSTETTPSPEALADPIERDSRSIYVGNVNYSATTAMLKDHFDECGSVQRVTILRNKYDGSPKGCAYVEFAELGSVELALTLDESLFQGKQIKVMRKRTNQPGMCRDRPPATFWKTGRRVAGPGPLRRTTKGFSTGGRGSTESECSQSPRQSRGSGSYRSAPY